MQGWGTTLEVESAKQLQGLMCSICQGISESHLKTTVRTDGLPSWRAVASCMYLA
jgi:hypothetical protein